MVRLSFALTKEDLYHYNYFTAWSAPWRARHRRSYWLKNILYAIVFVAIFVYVLYSKISWRNVAVLCIILAVYYIFIVPLWIKHNYRKFINKFSDDPNNAKFLSKTELTIDERGITEVTPETSTMHSWHAFVKRAETDQHIFLYLSTNFAVVIPKTAFSSEQERKSFDDYIAKYFPINAEFNTFSP